MPRRTTTPVENVRSYGRIAVSEDPGPNVTKITNAAQPYSLSWNKSVSNHLEAYILHPQLQHGVSTINLSYMAEKLSLDSMKLEQHVDRLGPDHSIIDDVRNLRAEQYLQIDTILKQRNGKLVSVHRDTVEIPTSMGHMHATTLTFVLSTTEPEVQGASNQSALTDIAAATLLASLPNIQVSPAEATKSLAERPSSRERLSRSPSPQRPGIPSRSEGTKFVESSEKLTSSSTLEAPATPTAPRAKSETPSSEIGRTQSGYDRGKRDQTEGDKSGSDQTEYDHTEHDHTEHDHTEHDHTEHDHTEHDHTEHDHTEHDHTEHDHTEHDQVEHDQNEHGQSEPNNMKHDIKLVQSNHSQSEPDQTKHYHSENDHSEPINTPEDSQDSPLSEGTISPTMSESRSDTATPKDHRFQNDADQSKPEERALNQDELDESRPNQGDPDDSIENPQKQTPFEDIDDTTIIRSKSETPLPKGPEVQSELEDTIKRLHKSPKLETATNFNLLKHKSEMPPPPPPARRGGTSSLTNTRIKIRDSTGPKAIADEQGPEKETTITEKSSPLLKVPPTPTLSEAKLETQQSSQKLKDPCIPTTTREHVPQPSLSKDTANEQELKKETYVAGKKSQLLKSPFTPTVPTVHSDTQKLSGKLEEPCIHMNEQDHAPQSSVSKGTENRQKLETEPAVSGKILLSDYFEGSQTLQTNLSGSKKKKRNKKKKKKNKSTANLTESPTQTRALSLSSSDVSTLAGDDDPTTSSIPEPFGTYSQNCNKCNAFLVVHSKQELERRECDLCRDFRDTGCALCKEDFQKLEKQGGSLKDMERSADGHRVFIAQCMAWSRQQKKTLDDWKAN